MPEFSPLPSSITPSDAARLAARVSGPVLLPDDSGFADEVAGFNLAVPYRPDAVVGVTNEHDVAEAVRFAREHHMPVRVHATGHGAHDPIVDGMLVSTRRLSSVTVDTATRIATIGAGAPWRAVLEAGAPYGLTGIPGSSVTVGAVGYTLGGGLGPLARSHGVSSDYARAFTVVTAAGDIVRASADEHPELFWALRGGKGGLGIVTSMELELVALAQVHAGSLVFEEEHIEAALRGWIEWTASADDRVTTSVAIMNLPPLEVIPEPLRGKRLLTLHFAFTADDAEGERLAAPLRSLAPVFIDTIGPLATSRLGEIHADPEQPGPGWSSGEMFGPIDQDFASALLTAVGPGTSSPVLGVDLRHLGGAVATDVDGGSAVGGRDAAFVMTVIGLPIPELFATVIPDFYAGLMAELHAWVSPGTTINFLAAPHDPEQFERAWPAATHERLRAVRALYDPDGLFTFGPTAA